VGVSFNALSLQVGGGVIIPISGRLGVRAGVDYRYAVAISTDLPLEARELRISGGLSIGLGRY
jgi:hypothetical protein